MLLLSIILLKTKSSNHPPVSTSQSAAISGQAGSNIPPSSGAPGKVDPVGATLVHTTAWAMK